MSQRQDSQTIVTLVYSRCRGKSPERRQTVEVADKEGVMKAWRLTVPTISTQYMQQLKAVSCYYPTLVALKQAICDTLTWCCVQLVALSPSWQ